MLHVRQETGSKHFNQIKLPAVGFGASRTQGAVAVETCLVALRTGYRMIDTAHAYNNEEEVAQAVMQSGVSRSKVSTHAEAEIAAVVLLRSHMLGRPDHQKI